MQVKNRSIYCAVIGIAFVMPFFAHAASSTEVRSPSWFCLRYDDTRPLAPLKKVREVTERISEQYLCGNRGPAQDLASSTAVTAAVQKVKVKAGIASRFTAFLAGIFPKALSLAKSLIKP